MRVKENECKEKKDMFGVFLKRKILMQHEESHENWDTMVYITIPRPRHLVTMQDMVQALCTDEHFHRVIGNGDCSLDQRVQFYVPSYARI